jgi:two-component system nitrate/nitrite response regulator NarL
VIIADAHGLFRDGLRKLFDSEAGFTIVGEASDGPQVVRLASEVASDVLLMGVSMPGMHCLEALRELRTRAPTVRTILLTAEIEKSLLLTALQLGARGIILKNSATATLFKCIRAVVGGQLSLVNITSGQEMVDVRAAAGQTAVDAWDAPDGRGAPVSPIHASRLLLRDSCPAPPAGRARSFGSTLPPV